MGLFSTGNEVPQQKPVNNETLMDQMDPGRKEYVMGIIRSEQRPGLGFIMGLLAAVAGAVVWAAISAATRHQIGWAAIGLGFLVGIAVRLGGKGIDKIYGVMGAFLALLGCILGNFFTILAITNIDNGISVARLMELMSFQLFIEIMKESFQPFDILFYILAITTGYSTSIRKLTEKDFQPGS